MTAATAIWTSSNGVQYKFQICDFYGAWRPLGGIYIMSANPTQGVWEPKYIGQASNFKERLAGHEQWPASMKLGATKVLALVVSRQADRDTIEKVLIEELAPPLNKLLRRPISLMDAFAPYPFATVSKVGGIKPPR